MQPFVLSFPRLAVNAKVLSGQGTTKPKSSAIVVNPRQVKYAEKRLIISTLLFVSTGQ